MSAFEDAVSAIRSNYVGIDYIDRVKASVAAELRALDPTATVEDTRYFNHSAIPDFVLSWRKDKLQRDVYLRGSYASIVASSDVVELPANDPVFLSLDKRQDFSEERTPITAIQIREESTKGAHTLMTDISAVGSLREVSSGGRASGPLAALVQSNFVRGARGLVDDERADELTSTDRSEGRTTISEVLRETFSAEAFLRMERTAAIVDLATATVTDRVAELESAAKLAGRLSDAEIAAVLPWVLTNGELDPPQSFWQNLGSLIEFEDLEKIADRLEGVDISQFIAANAGRWRVKRGYVGVGERNYDDPDRISRVWQFLGGTLTVDSDYHRVRLATRVLRGRAGSSMPRWNDIQEPLRNFRLQTVDLAGVTRRIRIDATQSEDIRGDTQKLTQELEDDYRVQSVGVRFVTTGRKREYADVTVDLSKALASTDDSVTIEEMLRTCLRIVAHRNTVPESEIARFTNRDAVSESLDVEPSAADDPPARSDGERDAGNDSGGNE